MKKPKLNSNLVNDPAYEAFRDRNDPGVISDFMEAQRGKAKRTKPVARF